MIPVKTQPRFKCDFCKYRSVKSVVAKHESVCFRNPNRFCPHCENNGFTDEWIAGDGKTEPAYYQSVPCPYCSKFNPKQLEEIKAREAKENPPKEAGIPIEDLPF